MHSASNSALVAMLQDSGTYCATRVHLAMAALAPVTGIASAQQAPNQKPAPQPQNSASHVRIVQRSAQPVRSKVIRCRAPQQNALHAGSGHTADATNSTGPTTKPGEHLAPEALVLAGDAIPGGAFTGIQGSSVWATSGAVGHALLHQALRSVRSSQVGARSLGGSNALLLLLLAPLLLLLAYNGRMLAGRTAAPSSAAFTGNTPWVPAADGAGGVATGSMYLGSSPSSAASAYSSGTPSAAKLGLFSSVPSVFTSRSLGQRKYAGRRRSSRSAAYTATSARGVAATATAGRSGSSAQEDLPLPKNQAPSDSAKLMSLTAGSSLSSQQHAGQGVVEDGGSREWRAGTNVRMLCIVPHGSAWPGGSVYKTTWGRVVEHTAQRLAWTDAGYQLMVFSPEELAAGQGVSQAAFLQAASTAHILVGVDLNQPPPPTSPSSSAQTSAPPTGLDQSPAPSAPISTLESFLQDAAQAGSLPSTRLFVGSSVQMQALTQLGGLALGDPRATWVQSLRLQVAK